MDTTPYPIKRLNRDEFAAALHKGQGRAFLHGQQYGLDEVADLVLEACLHNQAYDPQCEYERGNWLFSMFQDSPRLPEFRDSILEALAIETNTWDLAQLCELAKNLALAGDESARVALQSAVHDIAAGKNGDDWVGVQDWISLEGTNGLIEIARIYGRRLIADPDDFVSDSILFNDNKEANINILKEYSEKDPAVRIYLQYLEQRSKRNHPKGHKFSVSEVIKAARTGERIGLRLATFGKHATPEDLEQVFVEVLQENDDAVLARLLSVFRFAKPPKMDEKLLNWANSANENLRDAAIAALSHLRDERIHTFAIETVESGGFNGPNHNILELFIHNFESSDAHLITKCLYALEPDPDEIHHLGFEMMRVAKANEDLGLSEAVIWFYENNPCGLCRLDAVRWLDRLGLLPDELRYECQYDVEPDTRNIVKSSKNPMETQNDNG